MMKKHFLMMMVSLLTTAAMAQVNKVPADTRMYLKTVEEHNKQACARSGQSLRTLREAKLFISCAPDADTKAIERQIKALGARPHGTIDRYIMVSTPVGVVYQIAAIEGVTYISKGPRVDQKTVVSKEATGVAKVHAGSDGLPQAFTGKGVVVGVIDAGFDLTHPAYKNADGNLRIKSYYLPGMTRQEDDAVITTLDGTELEG